jgi:hypothetical protein
MVYLQLAVRDLVLIPIGSHVAPGAPFTIPYR